MYHGHYGWPAFAKNRFAFLLELDDETFRELLSSTAKQDEAIRFAANYLREAKSDMRIHIRESGNYLAEVKYIAWNGGRIEVEEHVDWQEDGGNVITYELLDNGNKRIITD